MTRTDNHTPVSLALPAALGVAAAIMLVPANLLPVLNTSNGPARDDTIFSGVVLLCEKGMWGIGVIVFIASLVVPLFKLFGLARLLIAARWGAKGRERQLTRLHAVLDFIGRWSMLDVFLVAFLSGVVRYDAFASVTPRPGIVAFAAAVVLTMLATRAFDPRVLWKNHPQEIPA